MKKILSLLIVFSFIAGNTAVFAHVESEEVQPPKWEDYVPEKYQNPRTDIKRNNAIKKMAIGGFLTDLLITAPIGIPMLCQGITDFKHVSYRDRKKKFYKGLEEAKQIQNPEKKAAYYEELLKSCKLKEKDKVKLAKKAAKKQAKLKKKKAKEQA